MLLASTIRCTWQVRPARRLLLGKWSSFSVVPSSRLLSTSRRRPSLPDLTFPSSICWTHRYLHQTAVSVTCSAVFESGSDECSNGLEEKAQALLQPLSPGGGDEQQLLRRLMTFFWPQARSSRLRVSAAASFMVLSKLARINAPRMLQGSLRRTENGNADMLKRLVGYGVLLSLGSFCQEARSAVFAKVSQDSASAVAANAFLRLHALDIDYLLGQRAGIVSSTSSRGISSVSQVLNAVLFQIVPTSLEFCLVMGSLASRLGLPVALTTAATMAAYVRFTFQVTHYRTDQRKAMNKAEGEAKAVLLDSLINAESVRFFTGEECIRTRYMKYRRAFGERSREVSESLAFLNAGQQMILATGLTTALALTAVRIARNDCHASDIVFLAGLLQQFSTPLNFIGSTYRETRNSLLDLKQLIALLGESREATRGAMETKKSLPPPGTPIRLAFENVSFHYPGTPTKDALRNVTFELSSDKRLAIVGPNGAGKSTIIKLIYRLYDPTSGRITVNGTDIREFPLREYRQLLGIVPQDLPLFNESLLFNLRFAKKDVTREDIAEAIRKARLGPLIKALPEGLLSSVGERGLKLSGGEKQRVGIARVFLRSPAVLLLDEATSSLDLRTEREVLDSFDDISRGKPRLTIAHRLATVMDSEEIVFLERGEVAERGTHQDLLVASDIGKYRNMWSQQFREESSSENTEMDAAGHDTSRGQPA